MVCNHNPTISEFFNRMTSNEREFDVEEVTDPSFLMVALRDRNDTTLSEEDEVGLGGY